MLSLEAAVSERAGYGDQDVRGEVHFHLGERCHLGQGAGVGDVCFFLTMRCFNDAMFSNS